jgi:anti-sigma factor RsiW
MSNVVHRIRFRLDHRWTPAHMSDYLDGDLEARPERRIEDHVTECAQCRRTLAALRAMLIALRALPPPAAEAQATRITTAVRLRLSGDGGPR